jgi:hypothetical protein
MCMRAAVCARWHDHPVRYNFVSVCWHHRKRTDVGNGFTLRGCGIFGPETEDPAHSARLVSFVAADDG